MIDERFRAAKSIIMQGIRSTMCVPLLYNDRAARRDAHGLDAGDASAFNERDLRPVLGHRRAGGGRHREQPAGAEDRARGVEAGPVQAPVVCRTWSTRIVSGQLTLKPGPVAARDARCCSPTIRGFTRDERASPARRRWWRRSTSTSRSWSTCCSATAARSTEAVGDEIIGLFGAPRGAARRAAALGPLRARHDARARGVQPPARRPGPPREDQHQQSTPACASPARSARRARCSTPSSATRMNIAARLVQPGQAPARSSSPSRPYSCPART